MEGGFGVPFPVNFAASWCPQHHLQLNGKQGAPTPSDAPTCAAPATVSERRVCPPSRQEEDGHRAGCPYATVPLGMGRRTGRFASPDTGQDGGSQSRCANRFTSRSERAEVGLRSAAVHEYGEHHRAKIRPRSRLVDRFEGTASRSCCQRPAGERVRLTLLVFST